MFTTAMTTSTASSKPPPPQTTSLPSTILCRDYGIPVIPPSNTSFPCEQCFDGTIQKYLWGFSCKSNASSNTIIGKCGLSFECVTTDIGECPYNEFCLNSSSGTFNIPYFYFLFKDKEIELVNIYLIILIL